MLNAHGDHCLNFAWRGRCRHDLTIVRSGHQLTLFRDVTMSNSAEEWILNLINESSKY